MVWAKRTVSGLARYGNLAAQRVHVCVPRQMHQMQTARNAAALQKER